MYANLGNCFPTEPRHFFNESLSKLISEPVLCFAFVEEVHLVVVHSLFRVPMRILDKAIGKLLSGGRSAFGELIRLRVAATPPLGKGHKAMEFLQSPSFRGGPLGGKDTQCAIDFAAAFPSFRIMRNSCQACGYASKS